MKEIKETVNIFEFKQSRAGSLLKESILFIIHLFKHYPVN